MQTALVYLKGVGPERARLLKEELQLRTYQDLLHFFPNRYIDRSRFYPINELPQNNAEIQIKGRITSVNFIQQKRGKRMVASFEDETGSIELIWFRGHQWIREQLKINETYVIFGRLNWFKGKVSMPHPELELERNFQTNLKISFYPIYPSTEKLINKGLSQKVIQKMVVQLLQLQTTPFSESLPSALLNQYKLIPKDTALRQVHFPENQHLLTRAQMRLKFEEFFYMQMQLVLKNIQRKQKIKGHDFQKVGHNFNDFFSRHLTFDLTNAQKRVIKEIRIDMGTGRQMNRLLQGDVGSGKTIVALLLMLIALDNDFQSCLVAPTEILAQQHFHSLEEQLKKLNSSVALLTGSSTKKERQAIHQGLQSGELNILIGTHAVFEDTVQFKNLGLAIIDEQHRFGVAQRAKLWQKNEVPPHVLVMTATPIPRTLAMSLYGDLDLSVIDELPPGRKKIKTLHRTDSNRLKVFAFVKEQIALGRQVYIVYPLIQESSKLDYKDLMDGYESLSRSFPIPNYQISIVHGQMKSEDKTYEMERFIQGKTQIMVATTVIEVGVNVPNASVMIIESAERFGLSQLHQLRGRVGRGAEQSYCILMTGSKLSREAQTRMETMTRSNDGFEIAEVDLRLRGPGNIMGTQQSGILQFKIADLIQDQALLKAAREQALRILKQDPSLKDADHQCIKRTLSALKFDSNIWNFIS
ncbi:ATP-dependent DNA helicase RecG [Flavobacteriaceae bacterium]|nr:ATP-dependent DNA helicase RecG [Flavobacteriaceae bacterium]MDA9016201.1 ATP-dependent DNA helicase RecG [Flavobacteriaceae bacterium]